MVTRLLKEFVRGVSSTASLTLEPVYACTYGDPIKADLEVRDEHELHVIDVVVVNPARAAPITGLPPEPDYAARQAQTAKRKDYALVTSAEVKSGFIAFAVEATGRLGPEALRFVEKISKGNTLARTYFLNCLSACIARYNSGSFASATRARLRYIKGNSWGEMNGELEEFYPREY